LRSGKDQGISSLLNRSEIKSHLFYSYGRVALLDGLRILACEEGSNVLLPSYICGVAVEPFHELGIEARFYAVSLNLQPDIIDVKNKIDEKTKGILVVNYFGFPQNIEEIQNICQKYGLYLIEDNAHGLLSQKNSRLLGTFVDIGFSSIWKILPVPNGAVLFLNNDELIERRGSIARFSASQNRFPKMSSYTYVLNSLLNDLELRYRFKAKFIRDIYKKLFPKVERNSSKQFQDSKVRICGVSLKVSNNINVEDVCRKRRENYDFWLGEMCKRKNVHIVFRDLPEGVCPLNFPVIAEEESILQEMIDKGIPVYRWPRLPKDIKNNQEYPNANFLARHMLTLPVHQNLTRDYLQRAWKKQ
jgi:dTDP-4-amino-4,6-dideoxygalactose transaminase